MKLNHQCALNVAAVVENNSLKVNANTGPANLFAGLLVLKTNLIAGDIIKV